MSSQIFSLGGCMWGIVGRERGGLGRYMWGMVGAERGGLCRYGGWQRETRRLR